MYNANVKKLVFSSSATVYGDMSKPPFNENSPRSCTNTYGRTKLMIEEILMDLSRSDPEWSVAVLRYFNPIGSHESGLIGENPSGIPNNIMPYISQVAIGKLERLNIFGYDYSTKDGTGVRDYIHVSDLAEGHVKAIDYISLNDGYHSFNLGTGKGYSVLDLLNTFERVNKVNIPFHLMGRRPGDVAVSFANVSKAKSEMGWTANRDLESMCIDAWRWQKNSSEVKILKD
jgi:UDP-glucose 4-epimerase